MSYGVPITGA